MLLMTELRLLAWRWRALSDRSRRSSQTAAGNPARSRTTSPVRTTPRALTPRECRRAMDCLPRLARAVPRWLRWRESTRTLDRGQRLAAPGARRSDVDAHEVARQPERPSIAPADVVDHILHEMRPDELGRHVL